MIHTLRCGRHYHFGSFITNRRCDVFTAIKVQVVVFWGMTPWKALTVKMDTAWPHCAASQHTSRRL